MAAPSGVCPAEERREGWRGLISSWFQSALLQQRSHSISRPQAAALRMPKYANNECQWEPSPRFQLPSGPYWWWTKQGYLLPMLPWVGKLKGAVILSSLEHPHPECVQKHLSVGWWWIQWRKTCDASLGFWASCFVTLILNVSGHSHYVLAQ